jgi:hypothetical protein
MLGNLEIIILMNLIENLKCDELKILWNMDRN